MESIKQPWKNDVNVLLIFFIREDVLKQTFEAIRQARPRRLLLWQDGARENMPDDIAKIEKCRVIVENIDWECEVYKNYQIRNWGCDPSTFYSHKWAFSIVDKCIVLEDDMVPKQSFFRYCKELLDKYEFDNRINHICGINFVEDAITYDSDYIFSYYGTGAWASWRRVEQGWDETYSFLNDKKAMRNLKKKLPKLFPSVYKTAMQHKVSGIAHWESILGFDAYLNNRLVIIPRVNMVTNIGVTPDATHGTSLRLMDKKTRGIFFMKSQDISFPLKHPHYYIVDADYLNEMSKINCKGRPLLAKWRIIQYYCRCIFYGVFFNKMKAKILGKKKFVMMNK